MLYGFLTITVLHMLALISPGPDYVLITQTALTSSRRHAVITALGIATGIWFHVLYCLLGIAIIIASSPLAYNGVRYLGAAYLTYLAIQSFRQPTHTPAAPSPQKISKQDIKAFRQGLLCNILNPKVTLFFLSIFTVVVDPATPLWLQTLYGLQMSLLTFAWFTLLAVMITHRAFKNRLSQWQTHVSRIMGFVFLGFAAYLVFHI